MQLHELAFQAVFLALSCNGTEGIWPFGQIGGSKSVMVQVPMTECAKRRTLSKFGMVYRESSNFVRAFLTSFRNPSYDSVFWLMVCSLPPHRVELRLFQRIISSTIGTKPWRVCVKLASAMQSI